MFDYPVVFVDIETTGGSYTNSRVLEVAVIRMEGDEVVREFSTLINPETYIPASITALTGIKQADVVGAPTFADVADELYEIMDGAVFIAHNVRFDYSFLKHEFALQGITFSPRLLCTVRLSRYLYAEHRGHSLKVLIARHDIPVLDRHRALADARAIQYFTQLAFDEHGMERFGQAIERQLKTQSLPPNLDAQELMQLENTPGVYIFRDDTNQPIYVGKSISLKKRIMSHFQDTSAKEVKISQHVHHVETIPTGSELGALVLESKLIKDMKPLYNRMLRRVLLYTVLIKTTQNGYAALTMKSGNVDMTTDLSLVYGVYSNRVKAKKALDDLTRTFQLCPKLMGLEKAKGACFRYTLGRCKGACLGREAPQAYNRRFEIALERSKLTEWMFDGPVIVPVNSAGQQVIIDNWMIQGFVDQEGMAVLDDTEPNFDLDEYKIIRRFIKENRQFVRKYRQ